MAETNPNRLQAERLGATGTPQTPGKEATPVRRGRKIPRRVLATVLAVVLVGAAFFGYRYYQDQSSYVSTDNALVTGGLVQVGSLNAGQVRSMAVDVGQRVTKNEVVATVTLPSPLSTTSEGTPKMGFLGTMDQQVSVRSPIDGIVVARLADPGDTVAAGQPLLTVVDPMHLWVEAQIEETEIDKVKSGQSVEVSVDSLGKSLPGRVVSVDRATESTFSLLPQANSSGSFTKVTQLVPVKIAVDYGQLPLVVGSSVEVQIDVRPGQHGRAEASPQSQPTSTKQAQPVPPQTTQPPAAQRTPQPAAPAQQSPALAPTAPQAEPRSPQAQSARPSSEQPAATGTTAPVATPLPASSGTKYTVQAGDTLSRIAEKFGTTVDAIVQANGMQNPSQIRPGQELVIPPASR